MTPGLKFFAEQIDPLHSPEELQRTPSTYGLLNLEGGPKRNELYVVCKDLSIQSVYEPSRPIGWELIEDEFDDWYYRVTQAGHQRKRCAVRYHSRTDDPPSGRGAVGSVVTIERPQDAEVVEQEDEGEEVTSKMRSLCG